jgi:hypothetical protein
MRAAQFWILLLGSSFVSVLLIKQIFLGRALDQEERLLVDSRETASTGPGYENAWKQLAIHIYQASRQDPALAQLLKNANVDIHANPAAGAGAAPATTPFAPPVSSKIPVAPVHPGAP